MALLDSDGPIDLYASLMAISWTTMWYLAFGLGVDAAKDLIPKAISWFGLLDAGDNDALSTGLPALGGAAYSFPILAINLPRFLGTETSVSRHTRHVFMFWTWMGWVLFNVVILVKDFNLAYSGTPANYAWLVNNSLMVYCHYQWVGRDVLAKLKLA